MVKVSICSVTRVQKATQKHRPKVFQKSKEKKDFLARNTFWRRRELGWPKLTPVLGELRFSNTDRAKIFASLRHNYLLLPPTMGCRRGKGESNPQRCWPSLSNFILKVHSLLVYGVNPEPNFPPWPLQATSQIIKANYKHKGMLICKEMTSSYLLHQ